MEAIITKIKCPCCGAVLAVKTQPGIENKKVTCPVCKESSPFKLYKTVIDKKVEESTEYPGKGSDERTSYRNNDETETNIGSGLNFALGRLKVLNVSVSSYRLKTGRNVIGRKASASTADFQIPVTGGKRMSREHLVIEVKKVPGKGFVHYASLYKQKVNETLVNQERLEFGDCVVLNHGDKIILPDVTMIFEIPDDEGTEF